MTHFNKIVHKQIHFYSQNEAKYVKLSGFSIKVKRVSILTMNAKLEYILW